jgi:post-segregation antitoxin (ccd killing protein)
MMNITVYLPDELAQEVRDADLPISNICQAALRRELYGVADPLERIAADLAQIKEALGIEAVDQLPPHQDDVEVGTAILLAAAKRRECLTYREFSERLGDRGVAIHWRSPRMGRLLLAISERRVANGHGLLSALVIASANGLPGEGFFGLAAKHGRVGDSQRMIWERERDRVFQEAQ